MQIEWDFQVTENRNVKMREEGSTAKQNCYRPISEGLIGLLLLESTKHVEQTNGHQNYIMEWIDTITWLTRTIYKLSTRRPSNKVQPTELTVKSICDATSSIDVFTKS